MPSVEARAAQLIDAITAAFQGVSREGGISLHETRVEDDLGSEVERAEARAKDVDENWQEVPYADIEKNDLSISFFDPIGFRYYIPVYMIWEIKQLVGAISTDSNNQGSALFALGIDESKVVGEWRWRRFDILSEQQSRVVYQFLRFIAEYGEERERDKAKEAIDEYWIKFA